MGLQSADDTLKTLSRGHEPVDDLLSFGALLLASFRADVVWHGINHLLPGTP